VALTKSSKAFLAVVLVGVLGVLGVVRVVGGERGGELAEAPVTVEVTPGMGANQVAALLEEHGVIRSSLSFRVQARLDDRATRIKAGTYELERGLSTDQILEILSTGPRGPDTFWVTIPEGLTVEQTLARIAAADSSPFSEEELRAALDGVPLPEWLPADLAADAEPFEGLLFPDTYEFRVDSDAQDVLARLVHETDRRLQSVAAPEGLSRYELLAMASLVERETRLQEERPMVAAVMHNRLGIGMALQIDATVLYALGEHKDRVLYEDLDVDSPWNTYRNPGLPPTPISGAGEAAIHAAANPADVDYLYYVVIDPDTGEHGFSRTLEEHNELRRQVQDG
jgi:UPF0755 protein